MFKLQDVQVRWTGALVLGLLVAVASGCRRGTGPAQTGTPTAKKVLDQMVEAYQSASTYRDRGVVRLSFRMNGVFQEDEADLAVSFQRPNRIGVRAYQLTMTSDGERLRAKIADPSTNDLDGQVVDREAPKKLALKELYEDVVLFNVMSSGLGGHPVQLELLLGDEPIQGFLADDAKRRLLADATLDDRDHYRVEVTSDGNKFVLWVDKEHATLRRLELPTKAIAADMAAEGDVGDVLLIADFEQCELNGEIPAGDFSFDVGENASLVSRFVTPPKPLPSDLFGKTPDDFSFVSLDESDVSRASMKGKTAVMMWFTNHAACTGSLQQLQKVFAANKDDSTLFYAVCTEPSTVSHEQIRQVMDDWGVQVPLVRDLNACGRDVFQIPGAPALIVLDKDSKLHIFEVGANPNLDEQLPEVLRRVRAGDDLAGEILARHKEEEEAYRNAVAASGGGLTATVEIPKAELKERTEPKQLKLTKLWANDKIGTPGNILVVAEPEPRIYVHDGFRAVVELDADGTELAKHELDLPKDQKISYLRTAIGADDKRVFLGGSILGKQIYLFDKNWKTTLAFPPLDQPHDGIHDAQIMDLDDDGSLDIFVGYWGIVGVQQVGLDGKRKLSNRSAANILSLAPVPYDVLGGKRLLVSNDRGRILRLNEFGDQEEVDAGERGIHHLYSASFGDRRMYYCGISYTPDGDLVGIGFDETFDELWDVKLPKGSFDTQLQFVTSGKLLDNDLGQWLIAGPDGSILFIGCDGSFFDNFRYGEFITGLAATQWDEKRVLLVATAKQVTAWQVEQTPSAD